MTKAQIIAGLLDLIEDRKSFVDPNKPESMFLNDIEVLTAALNELEGGQLGL